MDLESRQEPLEFYWKLLKKTPEIQNILIIVMGNNSYYEPNNNSSLIHVNKPTYSCMQEIILSTLQREDGIQVAI